MAKARESRTDRKKKGQRRQHKLLPEKPKRASNGFGAFLKEYWASLKSGNRNRNAVRQAAERWNALSGSEKVRYQNLVQADQNRYRTEMGLWKSQRTFLKRPANIYALFTKEIWEREKNKNDKKPPTIKKVGKMAGKEWKRLTKAQKDAYKQKFEQASRNYELSVRDFQGGAAVDLGRQLYTDEDYVSLLPPAAPAEANEEADEEEWSDDEWTEED